MMYIIVYIAMLVCVFPEVLSKDIVDRPELLFEGDIQLTAEQRAIIDEAKQVDGTNGIREKRKAVADVAKRWDDATVPYTISTALSTADAETIKAAIYRWTQRTCLTFPIRTTEDDYVEFTKGTGCWSYYGKIGGRQEISIGAGCGLITTIHEIGHAIGFWHEHSRPDRDDYITVNTANIQAGYEGNFDKLPSDLVDTKGIGYDIGSIMHYKSYTWAKAGTSVITVNNAADEWKLTKQGNCLSGADTQLANAIYECSSDVCVDSLGMKDGTIQDSQITSSSKWAPPWATKNYGAINARLDRPAGDGRTGGWSARTNDVNQWIQVDLSAVRSVSGIVIQGRSDSNQWVTKYNIQYSEDDITWQYVKDDEQNDLVFDGNSDRNTPSTSMFSTEVRARYIRIRPTEWHVHISMRFEILGCEDYETETCADSTDSDIDCPAWAANGNCTTNVNYMKANCKRSCYMCDGCCEDYHEDCPSWAYTGQCSNVQSTCQNSCKCTAHEDICADGASNCAWMKEQWTCGGIYHPENCKKTCGAC